MAIGDALSGLFGQSPIKPIQEHMAKAHECVLKLELFLDEVLANNWGKAENLQLEISELENAADDLKSSIRVQLPKSLFMAIPRGDLLELLTVQDAIANTAKDIAGLMLGRQMSIPSDMASQSKDFLQTSIAASAHALKAISELDELLETGFSNREVSRVENIITELDEIENINDQQQVALRSTLYGLENELPPVDVMFLYKIIDYIGELADLAQRVGNRLQLIIAR